MIKTVKTFDIQKKEVSQTNDSREMKSSLAQFLVYNNTVPIIFGALFLMTGGAFAATNPAVQQAVISETDSIQTIDNTYITSVDLDTFPMKFEIKNVQEDEANYYVTYAMYTLDVKDAVWQDIVYENTMKVQKNALNGDLGTYVQEELNELWAHERSRLKETQAQQRARGVTQKSVATVYGGLLGKFITPTETTFDEYVPTVAAVIPKSPVAESYQTMISSGETAGESVAGRQTQSSQATAQDVPQDTVSPVITLLGDTPTYISVGDVYVDLGVVAVDDRDPNPGKYAEIEGVAMTTPNIDTSAPGTYTILYKAIDASGNIGVAERVVIVESLIPPAAPAPTVDEGETPPQETTS